MRTCEMSQPGEFHLVVTLVITAMDQKMGTLNPLPEGVAATAGQGLLLIK